MPPALDGIASCLIGLTLVAVAGLLVYESRALIMGESAHPEIVRSVREIASSDPASRRTEILTMQLGAHQVLLNMDIQFQPDISSAALFRPSIGSRTTSAAPTGSQEHLPGKSKRCIRADRPPVDGRTTKRSPTSARTVDRLKSETTGRSRGDRNELRVAPLKRTWHARHPNRRTARAADKTGRRAGRPVWSGNLRLALVSVPVKLYPATRTGARISLPSDPRALGQARSVTKRSVPGIGPVDTDEIVKGFELGKGRYVLLEPEEIDEIKLEAKKTLDLVQFVEQGEIDPIWFDRPYYVVADGELAEEAYGVLRDALRASQASASASSSCAAASTSARSSPAAAACCWRPCALTTRCGTRPLFRRRCEDASPTQELLDLAAS